PETYLGVGLDIQMGNANFSRAVDFGTVCYGQLGPATCNGFGLAPQHADGQVAISGRDTSLGYNLGIWHEFSSGARIGIHYRSRIRYHLTGTADFTVPANAQILTAGGSFVSTGASADLVTPDSLSLSFSQPVKNKRIILLGDVDYTRWDSIQAINIRYNNPQQPVTVIPMNWRNTYRVSLGMIYQESDSWLLRGGVAWDETPVQDQQGQPGIPDNNRIWLSMGARYKPSRQNSIDFGLTHIVIHAMPVDLNQSPNGNLLGNMNLKGNVVAFQYNHTW
ncbi:MAG: outer membrane protein transport protein, partial [Pseudomonadota bacterium]|nr:outer membrane protein transport protein [Pseudomonadota bacterium]